MKKLNLKRVALVIFVIITVLSWNSSLLFLIIGGVGALISLISDKKLVSSLFEE